jgi:hypothetical protein
MLICALYAANVQHAICREVGLGAWTLRLQLTRQVTCMLCMPHVSLFRTAGDPHV